MTNLPRAETGFAQICGAPLHYESIGDGHPLVLIHEGIADSRMYDAQVDDFAKRYRVIRYDVHGFGRSGTPDVAYTNHGTLRDLLHYLGVERTYLLGMSMGGGIAIDFTLAYPTMVEAVIPVASGVGGYPPSDETMQKWAAIEAALGRGDVLGAIELGLRMWVDGPKRTPDQVDPVIRERVREMMTVFTRPEVHPEPLDRPAISRLAEIHVPTLIVVGDGDVPDILAQADLLFQGIAGAKKVVMPGVAHALNMERPEQLNRLVLDFLSPLLSQPEQ